MLRNFRFGLAFAAIALVALAAAQAQQFGTGTVFVTGKGDITFPFTPPQAAGATAGTINNTTIGATTPAAGTFTTVAATSVAATTITATTIAGAAAASTICATATPATAVDAVFHIATRAMILSSVSQVHRVAAGGTSTLQVTKDVATDAPGAGTDLLSAAFNLNATANTVQAGALVAVAATLTFAIGDRLAFDFADAIQSSAGIAITACFTPL